MAPDISHILSTYSDFLDLAMLKVSCVWLEWLKSLNFEGPNFEAPNFVKFYFFFILSCVSEIVMCQAYTI